MPSQLLIRLEKLLDARVARTVNAKERAAATEREHWPFPRGAWGRALSNIQSVVLHGTNGWPGTASAIEFSNRYRNIAAEPLKNGFGPQYFVDSNGNVYVLIGPENLVGAPRNTAHAELLNPLSLGIEQADFQDTHANPDTNTKYIHRLDSTKTATDADLTGRKVYAVLHPDDPDEFGLELGLVWFAMFPGYTGPGDLAAGVQPTGLGAPWRTSAADTTGAFWANSLFSERNYRSVALLLRFVLEQNGIPRNFLLLPYANFNDRGKADVFRKLILADPKCDDIVSNLGGHYTVTDIKAATAAFTTHYNASHWSSFLLNRPHCFRGVMSHFMSSDAHACPGPLLDWHRVAREVWDWWWYPFDIAVGGASPLVQFIPRDYLHARKSTPLIDYYFDARGLPGDYNAVKVPGTTIPEQFSLATPLSVAPVYALANGVIVAARLRASAGGPPGFLLTRHEVFYQTLTTGNPGRIDYDRAPTYVWSLITFLGQATNTVTQLSDDNPDWLNRLVIRLKECELAVAFHNDHPYVTKGFSDAELKLRTNLNTAWNYQPGEPRVRFDVDTHSVVNLPPLRPTTGTEIDRDAREYRRIANSLSTSQATLFPLEDGSTGTPVRLILGDFIGTPSTLPGGQTGIQIEIFSRDRLDVPGAVEGVVSAHGENWWPSVSARNETDAAANLPRDGRVWRYTTTAFLNWINTITWTSEWQKYGVDDPRNPGHPAPMPRPNPRVNL